MSYLTSDSRMPYGPYKGKSMYDVSNKYLLRLWGEGRFDGTDGQRVKCYITKNLDAIKNDLGRDRGDSFSFGW